MQTLTATYCPSLNDISQLNAGLGNLKILGLSGNSVTDFSFISNLSKVTSNTVRHAEGMPEHPITEYHYLDRTIAAEENGNTIPVDNPCVGKDGAPISFQNALPGDKAIPAGNTVYPSESEAMDAVDTSFTDKASVSGTKDDKNGTWAFSGWTAQTEGSTVKFTGSWSFAANAVPPAKSETPQTGNSILRVAAIALTSAALLCLTVYGQKKSQMKA